MLTSLTAARRRPRWVLLAAHGRRLAYARRRFSPWFLLFPLFWILVIGLLSSSDGARGAATAAGPRRRAAKGCCGNAMPAGKSNENRVPPAPAGTARRREIDVGEGRDGGVPGTHRARLTRSKPHCRLRDPAGNIRARAGPGPGPPRSSEIEWIFLRSIFLLVERAH